MVDIEDSDRRWDIHTDRQLAAAKGGTTAVTLLNSGSWLALLSQSGSLAEVGIGKALLLWGTGAFMGTLLWVLIYIGTQLQAMHDFDRENKRLIWAMDGSVAQIPRGIHLVNPAW